MKKGQPLARLDPQDAQLGADGARSALAGAEADHALAKAEVERYRDLFAKKFVSQAVLDARETAFNTTKARLEQARAQLATARNQSAYTTLAADADGVITAVSVEAGQVVAAGQTVMRFARPAEKEVVISRAGEPARGAARRRSRSTWPCSRRRRSRYAGEIREIARPRTR